jgi:Uma2 family endonuclease
MAQVLPQAQILPLVIRLKPLIELTDEQFFEFCQINPELRIERTAQGELLVMPPAGWETSNRNA